MSNDPNINLLKLLLNKPITEEYTQEWSKIIGLSKKEEGEGRISVLVFRVEEQWFAFEAKAVATIAAKAEVHKIPHRSNSYLEGVVNQGGRLKLAASLFSLLNLAKESKTSSSARTKMVTIGDEGKEWVFTVDEVVAVSLVSLCDIQNVPVTVVKSFSNYLKGIFYFHEKTVGIIDKDLLFTFLNSKVLRDYNV